jgi:hypothetical protein
MLTEDAGNKDCGVTRSPYINDCDYDVGNLTAPAAKASARLVSFHQKPFGAYSISMVYLPKACESERCRVHVAFHGCNQSSALAHPGNRFSDRFNDLPLLADGLFKN